MKNTLILYKSKLIKAVIVLICILMSFTFIPLIDNEGTTAKAAASIEIGDYVQMGTYYGEPILWRCVDIDENGPLMLSDKILCLKAFDASGGVTTGSHGRGDNIYRQSYGSNYWEDSNIRCWLNSTASAGNVDWTCGNKPDESHVWSKYNEYDTEAGFLTNFTQSERNCMKSVSQYQLLHYKEYDIMSSYGSTYHTFDSDIGDCVTNFNLAYKKKITDTMFLLDVRQVNKVYQNLGSYYRGKPTSECVEHSEYTNPSLKDENYWDYWLRSPGAFYSSSGSVRCVFSDGNIHNHSARDGDNGVRPAFYLNPSSTSFVSGNGSENNPFKVASSSVSTGEIKITIGGKTLKNDSSLGVPFIDENNRTQVPLRAVMEALNCMVSWDDASRMAIVSNKNTTVKVPIGQKYILVNGVKQMIDTAAIIKDNRTYLPIRAVLEAFGYDVAWNGDTRTIDVTVAKKVKEVATTISDEQLCNLAKAYYKKTHGTQPPFAEIDSTEGDMVTIHLFEIAYNHRATWDWYYIDRKTLKGTSDYSGNVDLNAV